MAQNTTQIRRLDAAEAQEVFESAALFFLGMSGAQFLSLYEHDDLTELDEEAVNAVLMLLPEPS